MEFLRKEQGVGTTADTTVPAICEQVRSALRGLVAKTEFVVTSTVLILKVRKDDSEGGDIKFGICGIRGSASAKRESDNVQQISITLATSGDDSSSADGADGADGQIGALVENGNEFQQAFVELGLKSLLDAPERRGRSLFTRGVDIDLDFALTEGGSISIIAAGDVKDESTHHLKVTISRGGPSK